MNLIIGNTSQFFTYFKEQDPNIIGVSSRNFDLSSIGFHEYNRAILTFGEHRTFADISLEDYISVNVDYTLEVINKIKDQCKTIVVFITSELWNNCSGGITLETPINYNYTHYIKSKEILRDKIMHLRESQGLNIIMVYPFNCNSPYRKDGFLFKKFINLINDKQPIIIGDLNFQRDLPHPKLLVETCLSSTEDAIIGSGNLTNMREFYTKILGCFDIEYKNYVTETPKIFQNTRLPFYYDTKEKYNGIIEDTIYDIKKYLKIF